MRFTFAIMTYNNEKYILETLESIKFQIENYGKNYVVDLLVSDDASTDRSVEIAKSWTESNSELFNKVIFFVNEENQGTVYNYQRIIHSVETENFKIIAGDDLFSSKNLFWHYEHLDEKSILDFMRLRLCDGRVYYKRSDVRRYLYCRKKRSYEQRLKVFHQGSFSNTPSLIYKKELYDRCVCEKVNSQFKYIEDYPTWYQMLKNTPELNYCFIDDEIVLYRMHGQSITRASAKNPIHKRLVDDSNRLNRLYYIDSHGIDRILLWINLHSSPDIPKILRPSFIIIAVQKFRNYLYSLVHIHEYRKLLSIIKRAANEESGYYAWINNDANSYLNRLGIDV